MQLSEIRTQTRFYTKTNTSTFSDTDLDREANNAYSFFVMELMRVQGYTNLTGTEVTTDFVTTDGLSAGDNGYNGEYAFASDVLEPVRFEVKYSSTDTPVRCTIYDMSQNYSSEYDEDDIQANFSEGSPYVTFFRNAYKIRPVNDGDDDISNGIHIWYEKRQDALSGDTDEPVFESNYHNLIPLKVAKAYAMRHSDKYSAVIAREYKDLFDGFKAFYRGRFPLKRGLAPRRHNYT
jgi:hypothetical protein